MSSTVPALGSLVARKYRVRELIGAGAMGRVYRAQNELTGKWVALKWVQPDAVEGQYASARLLREARAASKLRHPNVIDVYDVVQDGRSLWLVMELLEGMTLSAYLRHHRPPTLCVFIALIMQALEGVAAAHAAGVIHRDLKPENIFLVRNPVTGQLIVKVVDFGVAKLADQLSMTITETGAAVGTPYYMSLEQLRAERDIDARTDIYSFGVMLYEAIAGRMPYTANNVAELAIKLATTEPVAIDRLRPDVPSSLARVVNRACARERESRHPNTASLITALQPFAHEASFRRAMSNDAAALPLIAALDVPPVAAALSGFAPAAPVYVPTVPVPQAPHEIEDMRGARSLRGMRLWLALALLVGVGVAAGIGAVELVRVIGAQAVTARTMHKS